MLTHLQQINKEEWKYKEKRKTQCEALKFVNQQIDKKTNKCRKTKRKSKKEIEVLKWINQQTYKWTKKNRKRKGRAKLEF